MSDNSIIMGDNIYQEKALSVLTLQRILFCIFLVRTMQRKVLDIFDDWLKSKDLIVSVIERLALRIINHSEKKKKEEELNRLIKLLHNISLLALMNERFSEYLSRLLIDYKKGRKAFLELQELSLNIEVTILTLMKLIEDMAEESDKIIIYENKVWNTLRNTLQSRSILLNDLKEIKLTKKNLELVSQVANRYEDLMHELYRISEKLSEYGTKLDSNTTIQKL